MISLQFCAVLILGVALFILCDFLVFFSAGYLGGRPEYRFVFLLLVILKATLMFTAVFKVLLHFGLDFGGLFGWLARMDMFYFKILAALFVIMACLVFLLSLNERSRFSHDRHENIEG